MRRGFVFITNALVMSWKTLITTQAFGSPRESAWKLLLANGCEVKAKFGPLSAEELAQAINGADATLCGPDAYTKEFFQRAESANLKIISRWGVGHDSIDITAATKAGIVVAYTPGLLDDAVADYTFALLLTLARRTAEADAAIKAGRWEALWGCDLAGKTLGIIGCGRIGQAVARRAKGFGLRLLGYDLLENPALRSLGIEYAPLPKLLASSDFVTLHAALTPQSHAMIGEAEFRQMKPNALFINTARGAHVNEKALVKALREKRIGGAALDVFAEEPLPADHPFRSISNLLLSPHQAACARETRERISTAAAQAIIDLMRGQTPQWIANPKVFHSPTLRPPLCPTRTAQFLEGKNAVDKI